MDSNLPNRPGAPTHNRAAEPSYPRVWTKTADGVSPGDEELMLAYQRGDKAAFDQLFARYQDRVYGYFARTTRESLAADLFQQTFLRVHHARASYDASRPFVTWLFTIAANLRKDEFKKLARRPGDGAMGGEDELVGIRTDAPGPDAALDEAERLRHLDEALAALPESQREVIVLHKLEGLSFPQIAEALGEAVEAVKGRAFRGYRALRRILDARSSS